MKGRDNSQPVERPPLELVGDLTPVPPDWRIVLEEVEEFAAKGARKGCDNPDAVDDISRDIMAEVAVKLAKNPRYLADPDERKRVAFSAGKKRAARWFRQQRTFEDLSEEEQSDYMESRGQWSNPDQTLTEREFRTACEHELELLEPDESAVWRRRHEVGEKPGEIDPENARSLSVKLTRINTKLRNRLLRFRPGQET